MDLLCLFYITVTDLRILSLLHRGDVTNYHMSAIRRRYWLHGTTFIIVSYSMSFQENFENHDIVTQCMGKEKLKVEHRAVFVYGTAEN